MNKAIGLWIDHRVTVLVSLTNEGEQTRRIESGMEKHVRFSGGAVQGTEEDIRDRRFTNYLNTYYAEVIAAIGDADSILIFGPGEAKGELAKRLESGNLTGRIAGLETVDKMTERQISAKVRQYFSDKASHNVHKRPA